jgi:hypothetical protein
MPYIADRFRDELDPFANDFTLVAGTAGALNYQVTKLMISYLRVHGLSYQHINACMGACQGASAELYRRVAAPYEDTKIRDNGDLYPKEMTNHD